MSYAETFSAAERREVTLQCVMGALEAVAGGLGEAAALQVLIGLWLLGTWSGLPS